MCLYCRVHNLKDLGGGVKVQQGEMPLPVPSPNAPLHTSKDGCAKRYTYKSNQDIHLGLLDRKLAEDYACEGLKSYEVCNIPIIESVDYISRDGPDTPTLFITKNLRADEFLRLRVTVCPCTGISYSN